nr:MAG TPA: hypothetical protein [Caudoviricetes sp.]
MDKNKPSKYGLFFFYFLNRNCILPEIRLKIKKQENT